MRILMLAGQFYPDLAGSGIATHSIAVDLARRGHSVTICVDSTNTYLDVVNPNPPFSLKFIPEFKKFMTGDAGFVVPTKAIYEVLESGTFDVVHVYSYMPMLLLSLMRDAIRVPIFFTFWNAPSRGERALGLYEKSALDLELARQIIGYRKYDRMILGSKSSYESALDLGADLSITSFVYHGITLSDFVNNLQNQVGSLSDYFDCKTADNETTITLPGRITARKGVYEAVRALAIVNKAHNAKLLLTGTGGKGDKTAVEKVIELAESLGMKDRIGISKEMIPQEKMPVLYKESDVVITPSYYEGLGFTAIEALAAARPLVMTDVQGLNEVGVNDVNCLMVPAKNAQALAEAIIKLIEDKKLAERLSKNGPKSVQKFDMELFVDYLLKVYEE